MPEAESDAAVPQEGGSGSQRAGAKWSPRAGPQQLWVTPRAANAAHPVESPEELHPTPQFPVELDYWSPNEVPGHHGSEGEPASASMLGSSSLVPTPDQPSAFPTLSYSPARSRRPTMLTVDTTDIRQLSAAEGPSPSIRHWEQVREHVLAPPVTARKGKQHSTDVNVITRAPGRFGLRNAIHNVMGYDRRRGSTMGIFDASAGHMTEEERADASRDRRRFTRDIKSSLEACALEESRRRFKGVSHATPKPTDSNEFSPFAPLLMELHKYLPSARSKRIWCRTCPQHAELLAELGTPFIPNSTSTGGERAQALEVFVTIVRGWHADNSEEEMDRWMWVCRAMLFEDRQLRSRGLAVLTAMLRGDSSFPISHQRPRTAADFETIAVGLLLLLHAMRYSQHPTQEHVQAVEELMTALGRGKIVKVDHGSLLDNIDEVVDSSHGVERELLWMAVAQAISHNDRIADWLLDDQGKALLHYRPPPALPAMPGLVRTLRVLSTLQLFASFLSLTYNGALAATVREIAISLFDDCAILTDPCNILPQFAAVMVALEVLSAHSGDAPTQGYDSLEMLLSGADDLLLTEVSSHLTQALPWHVLLQAVQILLGSKLHALGEACLPGTLAALPPDAEVAPFLTWLSQHFPHLFYKPLFACTASQNVATLDQPLRLVQRMANYLGTAFWTLAQPQMVIVVLVGDATARRADPTIRLGRYAVMVEFIVAVKTLHTVTPDIAKFLATVESGLAVLLEKEDQEHGLPEGYRSLACQMFHHLRNAAKINKRNATTRLAVTWFTNRSRLLPDSQLQALGRAYHSLGHSSHAPHLAVIFAPLSSTTVLLVVTTQASLNSTQWLSLLPEVWRRYGSPGSHQAPLSFLLMRCLEAAAKNGRVNELLSDATANLDGDLRKLLILHGYRHQVTAQSSISGTDASTFKFPVQTLDFVTTEIGSQEWSTPRDAQEAALQRFGRGLPSELRLRLMELGWTDQDDMSSAELERVPVTRLPLLSGSFHVPEDSSTLRVSSSSPRATRVAVTGGLLVALHDLARPALRSPDLGTYTLYLELLSLWQREEAKLAIRPSADNLSTATETSIARLNTPATTGIPPFAYVAVNALTGYLKSLPPGDNAIPHWAALLCTVARFINSVSDVSLRGIRKVKAEHLLLPASIHDDESGIKLHAPWRSSMVDVQTGQLLLLARLLHANSRDVYLVKKMLFNLQVQESLRELAFARAWLQLVIETFGRVNTNYNDRAELRHFVGNISTTLIEHGSSDIVVVSLAMRSLSLCASRFRRVFASIGFQDVSAVLYRTYFKGHSAIKDAVEHACRSFYRIHRDIFVLQLCLGLADDIVNPCAAYSLLASLAPGSPPSGAASGLLAVNDGSEALMDMLAGGEEVPKLSSRDDQKVEDFTLEPSGFSQENVIRLLVTVIAYNAASDRAIKLTALFAAIIPYLRDYSSKKLLQEAVEVVGRFISKRRATTEDSAMQRFLPVDESAMNDWTRACQTYVHLVNAYAKSGGHISTLITRRLLEAVISVAPSPDVNIDEIFAAVARLHLDSDDPALFLRQLAPIYRQRVESVDFSSLLDAMSALVKLRGPNLSPSLAVLLIDEYLSPTMTRLAATGKSTNIFSVPQRRAAVDLLAALISVRNCEALKILEGMTATASILMGVILPLITQVQLPTDNQAAAEAFWVRILRLALRTPESAGVVTVLCLQIVKIVAIKSPQSISAVPGLWSKLSSDLSLFVEHGEAGWYVHQRTPRIVDWAMWTLFELPLLRRIPLQMELRVLIQRAVATLHGPASESIAAGHNLRPYPETSMSTDVGQGSAAARRSSRNMSGAICRPTSRRLRPPPATRIIPAMAHPTWPRRMSTPSTNLEVSPPVDGASSVSETSFVATCARRASRSASCATFDMPSNAPPGRPPSASKLNAPLDDSSVRTAELRNSISVVTAPRSDSPFRRDCDFLYGPVSSEALHDDAYRAVEAVLSCCGLASFRHDATARHGDDPLLDIFEQTQLLLAQEFGTTRLPPA